MYSRVCRSRALTADRGVSSEDHVGVPRVVRVLPVVRRIRPSLVRFFEDLTAREQHSAGRPGPQPFVVRLGRRQGERERRAVMRRRGPGPAARIPTPTSRAAHPRAVRRGVLPSAVPVRRQRARLALGEQINGPFPATLFENVPSVAVATD